MGKRGGARVVYYYHSERIPLFLLTVYAKNETENLTDAQTKSMARIVEIILTRYGK